jgi:hypothetical protein
MNQALYAHMNNKRKMKKKKKKISATMYHQHNTNYKNKTLKNKCFASEDITFRLICSFHITGDSGA